MHEPHATMATTDLWENPAALALVDEEVERAVAPYIGALTPERLDAMRHFIRDSLLAHPTLSRATALAVRGPVVERSTAIDGDPATVDDTQKDRDRGG